MLNRKQKLGIKLMIVTLLANFSLTIAGIHNAATWTPNTAYALAGTCASNGQVVDDMSKCPPATTDTTTPKLDQTTQDTMKKIATIVLTGEKFLNKIFWPVLVMIGGLINNELLFSNGMDQRLYDIWVPIRNIVNIIFVIALVGIALYSVLGVSSEGNNYSIKAMLPKLIVGIIAVNFSFIAIKVMLDATNVLTTAIFAIPSQTTAGLSTVLSNDDIHKDQITRMCLKLHNATNANGITEDIKTLAFSKFRKELKISDTASLAEMQNLLGASSDPKIREAYDAEVATLTDKDWCDVGTGKIILSSDGQEFFRKYGSNNAALAMAINMSGILFSDASSSTTMLSQNSVESLVLSIIFSFALNAIYIFAFLALFLILIARLVVMWISLAFSPFIALGLTVPAVKEKIPAFGKLTEYFSKHLFAPITIAATMMVGWVMLNALNGQMGTATVLGLPIDGFPLPGLETLQGIMVSACTAAVVWMGAKSAGEGTLFGGVIEGGAGLLQRAGTFLGKAPFMYMPWIPTNLKDDSGNEILASGQNIQESIGMIKNKLATSRRAKSTELVNKMGFGDNSGEVNTPEAIVGTTSPAQFAKFMKENTRLNDPVEREKIAKQLQSLKGTGSMLETELRTMAVKGLGQNQLFAKEAVAIMDKTDGKLEAATANAMKNNATALAATATAATATAGAAADASKAKAPKAKNPAEKLEEGDSHFAATIVDAGYGNADAKEAHMVASFNSLNGASEARKALSATSDTTPQETITKTATDYVKHLKDIKKKDGKGMTPAEIQAAVTKAQTEIQNTKVTAALTAALAGTAGTPPAAGGTP